VYVDTQRQGTPAAQASQDGTFNTDGYSGIVVGDGSEQALGPMIVGPTIDGDGTLGRCRGAFGYWI